MIQPGRSFYKLKWISAVCLCLFMAACAARGDALNDEAAINTDLYSILRSPASFDGKLVDVSGFICLATDNSALLFSYRYCVKSDGKVGVGLHLGSEQYKTREEFGHKSYGEVIGVVHTLKPNQAWIDNGLGSIWIEASRITARAEPFVWSYDVTAPVNQSDPVYTKIVDITKTVLDGAKNRDYSKLARVFSPRNDEMMQAYEKDFQNSEKRLSWVFFTAPHSINSALNASRDLSTQIEVYETAKPNEYLSCTTIGGNSKSFQPGVDFLLRGGNKFCFTILHGDLISDSAFEYQ